MARMDDGFSTTIAFGQGTTATVYEKEVTPPGIQAGGAIDTTTMLNTTWRTMNPKALKTLSESSLVIAYDDEAYSELLSIVGVNGLITITFPDLDTLAFYGWMDSFEPNASVEGEQPTANITIIPSNHNAGVETAPVWTDTP